MIDQEDEGGEIGALQPHAARNAHGVDGAGLGMMTAVFGPARVVQQHGQVKNVWPGKLLEQGTIFGEGRFLGVDDPVEHLQADEGVFVGGVTVKEFMLHQAGQGAKLREEAAEEAEFVHGAQRVPDLSPCVIKWPGAFHAPQSDR